MCKAENPVRKTVIINRAVPCSGKTTISRSIEAVLENHGLTVSIHSNDDYFLTEEGTYQFDIHAYG